jgi:hypothetical protein
MVMTATQRGGSLRKKVFMQPGQSGLGESEKAG